MAKRGRGRPRLIPEELYPEILEWRAQRISSDKIADRLTERLGKKINGRTVRLLIAQERVERAPIADELLKERLRPRVGADLDKVDEIDKEAEGYRIAAGNLHDLLLEADRIAKADIRKLAKSDGTVFRLQEMPDEIAAAVSSFKILEKFEGEGAARVKVGEVVEVKLWNKIDGIDMAAKIRSGHMAVEAMRMQKSLLELRFKLSGAGGGKGDSEPDGVVILGPEGD